VVDALCRLLPDADVFTLFCDPESLSEEVRRHRVTASFLNPLRRGYRSLLPLMPTALESFDLRGYDLVVSSESGPAKGVITASTTRHVCYCHTPMRYLWDLYPVYRHEWTHSAVKRALMAPVSNYLRLWDFASAARVDRFVANSENVRNRIWKTYRREADVIYPPVDVASCFWRAPADYYLVVSELVAYKRIDLAVRAFSRTGRRLMVVGDGPEYKSLKSIAGPNVEFTGHISDAELHEVFARARAFLMPGEEDFGMTTVEALASGKPVLAFGRGGALETVPAFGGVFFDEPTQVSLLSGLERLDALERGVRPVELRAWAERFSPEEFARRMSPLLANEALGPAPGLTPVPVTAARRNA